MVGSYLNLMGDALLTMHLVMRIMRQTHDGFIHARKAAPVREVLHLDSVLSIVHIAGREREDRI